MKFQIEIYVSIDNENYYKLDLDKGNSINMKLVLKDTTDLSKIFSPYSQSFNFPATLNNQKILGFIGDVKVLKSKTDSVFSCKIYNNGLINQTGKLKITDVTEENGRLKQYTGNFTTTLLSLKDRMGEDLINDLPDNQVTINWLPNDVYNSISSVKVANVQPMTGIDTKYYVPLISNTRVFQRDKNIYDNAALDNVAYNPNVSPTSNKVIKADELSPAVNGKSIIDMIKSKYGLNIVMPIENENFYKDWYVFCNAEQTTNLVPIEFDIVKQFGSLIRYKAKNSGHIPNPQKFYISANTSTNLFDILKTNADPDYDKEVQFFVKLNNVTSTKGATTVNVTFVLELENGSVYNQISSGKDSSGNIEVKFVIPDSDFVAGHFKFKIKQKSDTPIIWSNAECKIEYKYYDGKYGPFNSTSYGYYRQSSLNNLNSNTMGSTRIDLYKSIPETKCYDFLNSFIKMFNLSIFDASPNDDRLFWLTPNDLLATNKEYSKTEVDYTPYIVSKSVSKKIASEYNYYNFKHKTSKYWSNANYLTIRGYEFGQLTYPEIKPTQDLNEYKVETGFCIMEAVPIAGMSDEFTCYGFTSDTPEILETGEKRYKPNTSDLTIFFNSGLRTLSGEKRLGFQGVTGNNVLSVLPLNSYIKTSPVYKDGFSLGFGLIQEAILQSLYYWFYKAQTERLLNPNTLQHTYELNLPASELVLNFANNKQGESNIPTGFRLQNDIILQELKFSSIDVTIDITTGNAKMNLLNY